MVVLQKCNSLGGWIQNKSRWVDSTWRLCCFLSNRIVKEEQANREAEDREVRTDTERGNETCTSHNKPQGKPSVTREAWGYTSLGEEDFTNPVLPTNLVKNP